MISIDSLTFPSFYAECAYRDGVRSIREGKPEYVACYMRHGEAEPIGMPWFIKGMQAAALGLVGK